jgi:hypothetical protein
MAQYRQSPEVVHESINGRSTLVDPSGQELITLNPVGSLVWEALGTPMDHQELTRSIVERFPDVDAEQVANDVGEFIDELLDIGLVVAVDD